MDRLLFLEVFFFKSLQGEINLSFLCRMLRAPGLDDAPIHQFLTDIEAF